jgi:tetratricopeptide (TPR) repeat protein
MVLDILAQNNWERPVYFAITVGSESYQNLDAYFRLDGFTYRVVPIKTTSDNGDKGSINSDILYKNVMEKFQWGGINDPRVYLDENNLRMLMNVKNNFLRLASKLIDQRKTDKARQVLAKCYEVMPFECVAPSFYDIFLADLYYRMGDNDKAREIIDVVVNQTCQELVYFNSLSEEQVATVQEDRYRAAAFSHEIVRIMSENHDTENARTYAKKFADIIATFPEIVKFESMDMNSPAFGQWYQTLPQNRQQVIAIYLYLIDPNQL